MKQEITPERWQQIERLYHSALEHDPTQRRAFLQQACAGDDALREEVESLLARGQTTDGLLDHSSVGEMAAQMFAKQDDRSLLGTKLGSYQVLALLGSGGMGEVYQAHDNKLRRDVAIKVLPVAFVHDAERLARFQREARLLASLNHPNIATIHGLEQFDGVHYLVMELVPGQTLAERISKGAVPLAEALKVAGQIAEALEAAHERGVIHRDLKPANVKVTTEGRVKVLDFGLAKAFAGEGGQDVSDGLTLSEEGRILGTPAYMSPEQARGKPVDKRTDIWSFGCVLYELLTGKQAFGGGTLSDTIAAVLERAPDWQGLPASTPAKIRDLLRRCLQKDKTLRLRDAGDARIEIDEVLTAPATADAATATPATKGWRERLAWPPAAVLLLAAIALAVALAGWGAFVYLRPAPAAAPEMRTEIVVPSTSDPVSFALSPDGRMIVFAASSDGPLRLWLRRLDATEAQPLAGTEGASFPFWSPDDRSVGFCADNRLKRMDIAGGSPQTLADTTSFCRGGAWSPDGTILFTNNRGPLFRIPASGGQPVAVTKLLDKQIHHRFPQFLPDSRQFLFYAVAVTPEAAGIYLGSLDSSEAKRLTADAAGTYRDGWLLFVRRDALVAQRLDLGHKALTGEPVTIADPVAFDASTRAGGFSVSANGLVAYRSGGASQRQLVWFDRSGKNLGTLGPPDSGDLMAPGLSPDGRRAAVQRSVQGNTDIWLMDATRTTRLTFDTSVDRDPLWSPDGGHIVFDSDRKGYRDLYVKSSNGAGNEEPLLESAHNKIPVDWSRDGRFLLYNDSDPQTTATTWVLPMEGNKKPFGFLKSNLGSNFGEGGAKFSPDGRWVAYLSNESGRLEIYVRPFTGASSGAATGQWQVSTSGGVTPRWRADGKELYYVAPDGKLMAAPVAVNGATFLPGTPVALFQTRRPGSGRDDSLGTEYDVSGDGRFLIMMSEDITAPITLLQNWNPEAKK